MAADICGPRIAAPSRAPSVARTRTAAGPRLGGRRPPAGLWPGAAIRSRRVPRDTERRALRGGVGGGGSALLASAVAAVGDLDGSGSVDLLVGAPQARRPRPPEPCSGPSRLSSPSPVRLGPPPESGSSPPCTSAAEGVSCSRPVRLGPEPLISHPRSPHPATDAASLGCIPILPPSTRNLQLTWSRQNKVTGREGSSLPVTGNAMRYQQTRVF